MQISTHSDHPFFTFLIPKLKQKILMIAAASGFRMISLGKIPETSFLLSCSPGLENPSLRNYNISKKSFMIHGKAFWKAGFGFVKTPLSSSGQYISSVDPLQRVVDEYLVFLTGINRIVDDDLCLDLTFGVLTEN